MKVNTTVTVKCNHGYELSGGTQLTCTERGVQPGDVNCAKLKTGEYCTKTVLNLKLVSTVPKLC